MVIDVHLRGQDLEAPNFEELRWEWKLPALITCRWWIDIYYETGDICPNHATGNKHSTREILGETL